MASKLQDPKIHGCRSAFVYYIESCRHEYERTHPNETPNFTQFIQSCKNRWKLMSNSDKASFQKQAEADNIRYNNELLQNGIEPPSLEEQHTRKRKQFENPHIQQVLSAISWFRTDHRSIVEAENPTFTQDEVTMEMARRWIAAAAEVKQKYKAQSEEELKQYEPENGTNKKE